jgi:CubicO group peptidase (beta-lactamase class C family)
MSDQPKLLKILTGTLLALIMAVTVLLFSPFKLKVQDWLALEVNAHINELMASPTNTLMSAPEPIAGTPSAASQITTNLLTDQNASLDLWFDKSQTQALIVQKHGEVVYERYREDAQQGLNINGMSMAKSIIAILIGVAIDDGVIDSETDSISRYLPELSQQSSRVEIRDLLRHTSGIQSSIKH